MTTKTRKLLFRIEVGLGLLLLSLAVIALFTAGCQHNLATGGVYNGDKVLYETDNTLTTAHSLLQDFVTWEANYRPQLAQFPQIKALADKVYSDGPGWFASAATLRDAYKNNPNTDTLTAMNTAVAVIQAALKEATGYLTANKSIGPPVTKPATTATK